MKGASWASMEPGSARFQFRSFKRILECNTAALERMAQMDRAMGGEYVFDKAFLESCVRDVCRLTHLAAYHLNGMADEGFVDLYDAFLAVKDSLEDILSGGMGPLAGRLTLSFSEIGWELEPLAGLASAGLAVLGRRMGLPAPDGEAVTVTAMERLRAGHDREVLQAVAGAVDALYGRLGARPPLELTLAGAGGEGGPGRVLASAVAVDAQQAASAVAGFARTREAGPAAVCIRPRVTGVVHGSIQTLAYDPHLPPAMLAVAASPDQPALEDRLWLSRGAPHPLRARLAEKPLGLALPGGEALSVAHGRSLRGSGWLTPERAAQLAEIGLAAERAMGSPCLLRWALAGDGRFTVTGFEPPEAACPQWPQEHGPDPELPRPLMTGGQIACGGAGAGPVVALDEDTRPESVPLGSVGVARAAVPALSRVVPRLGALLAEVGTAASHLATVARENRVPAVFGLKGAAALPEGEIVTVDADQPAVYPGVAEGLLRQAAMQGACMAAEPEYQVLGRLLRHIRPLNLVDPEAATFSPGHCRTCHDILHFAHEKAVDLLLRCGLERSGAPGSGRRLKGDAPFELMIVDLGGALAGADGDVDLAEVTSPPLRAFLDGMLREDVRRRAPAGMSLADIISGMGRTAKAMSAPAAPAGGNLALAARDYVNVTLRLGYHFSVVDAAVSDRPEHTFVYFRYAGGFAGSDRRARRAGLILEVLERLGFRAACKGDLVVGKRKLMEKDEALRVLDTLGALSAFTRQMDVELVSDEAARGFASRFLELAGLPGAAREGA